MTGEPRRFGAGALILVALVSVALASSATWQVSRALTQRSGQRQPAQRWQCPMHPQIIRDQAGECPICGMKLVPMAGVAASGSAPAAAGQRKLLFYRSPMDPKITSPVPRKDEMGMDFVPVYDDETRGASSVPGLAVVEIDPARQQLIGLKTVEVTLGKVGGAWRTAGRVTVDETRVRHVNSKVSGYVERIYVDFVGKKVKRGDALYSVYSPELYAAQSEYLLALKTQGELSKLAALGDAGAQEDGLVAAARRKLELWDIPPGEIARIGRTGKPTKTLTIHSPVAGVVTKKDVVEGMKLDAGTMPYEVVDLSTVWVLADVYESEVHHVKEGMDATLTLSALPGRELKGKVLFLDPLLDPQTRTLKVRLSFPNPAGDLRPEMFGEVVLLGPSREGPRIPVDAVIDSGTDKFVFVALGEGKLEPRKVKLGDGDGTFVGVLSGVSVGERVVVRANFLVDSESRLRASLGEVSAGAMAPAPERARVLPEAPAALPATSAPIHDHGAHEHP